MVEQTYTAQHLQQLIRSNRVRADVYTDPDLFALEIERIFARTWNYVAHQSQLPERADYLTTTVAQRPVIVIRHADGSVRAMRNRCAHRDTGITTPCLC